MRDAMIAGMNLNIFNNHADRVRVANLAQIVNVLQSVVLTKEEKMLLTPTYHVMKMYNVHQDATQVPISLQTDNYEYNGKKLPAVSVSASKDKNGDLNISLTNIDYSKTQEFTIDLRGEEFNKLTGSILSSAKITDYNSFENPNLISPKAFSGAKFEKNQIKITLPAFSVVVLNLKK
jgi:alpha-N-arabinofuranosidase